MRRALALAALLAGCGGHSNVQVNSGGISGGSGANIQGSSTLGTLLSIVFLAGVSYESDRTVLRPEHVPFHDRAPELDPTRRVLEHDCTKPIEDWSANLKCR